jgi:outer membrane protein OmpA-like peptidoglycan-associated protein
MVNMYKKAVLSAGVIALSAGLNAQVKNAALSCSVKPVNYHQVMMANGWTNANGGTVDAFDKSSNSTFVGIPENYMGKQDAVGSENYLGLFAAYDPDAGDIVSTIGTTLGMMDESKNSGVTAYTEYAQAELETPLTAGEVYKFTYKISLSDKSGRAISGFGAYFSANMLSEKTTGLLKVTPSFVTKNVVKDKEGWTEITGEFKAAGGEKFVVIGVFKDGYSIEKVVDKTQMDNKRAYYYLAGNMDLKLARPDRDKDGTPDDSDPCPDVAGPTNTKGCPDRDSDGIADKDDTCPDQAGIAAFMGCPDTDGDGISDNKDACPSVKGTAAMNGCPDTDGDGIADDADKCPTVVGVASNKGCPEVKIDDKAKEIFKKAMTGIQFETGKDIIKKTSYPILDNVVQVLKDNPKWDVEVQGHTDNVGKAESNKALSQRRAEAVDNYLISKGIDKNRLTAVGFGPDKPVADNKTPAGRAKNRRVEFVVSMVQ